LKNAPEKFLLTITTPLGYWYLRNFDLTNIPPLVDFMNIMAYDIHGVWDANIASLGPYVHSHTNITEIQDSLNIYFKNGVPANKMVLG
jgi:chitinase